MTRLGALALVGGCRVLPLFRKGEQQRWQEESGVMFWGRVGVGGGCRWRAVTSGLGGLFGEAIQQRAYALVTPPQMFL